MKRCLILNCSKAKRHTSAKIKAIDLYDGPAFRVIRLFLQKNKASYQDIDIYVISAKHGMISGNTLIGEYDEHITTQRASEINPQVKKQLRAIIKNAYSEIFVLISKEYLNAFRGYEEFLSLTTKLTISTLSEGRRLRVLKSWLYITDDYDRKPIKKILVTGHAVLKGYKLEASPEVIMQLALKALEEEQGSPYNIRDWFVVINNKRVSPKWLVSLLTGLDVSKFQAEDARRVLALLGVQVNHV